MAKVTYKQAGVDIDAADRFIGLIKPLVRSTGRPEVLGGIGGFSGPFRSPPAGARRRRPRDRPRLPGGPLRPRRRRDGRAPRALRTGEMGPGRLLRRPG